jgi:hypothetical protein
MFLAILLSAILLLGVLTMVVEVGPQLADLIKTVAIVIGITIVLYALYRNV